MAECRGLGFVGRYIVACCGGCLYGFSFDILVEDCAVSGFYLVLVLIAVSVELDFIMRNKVIIIVVSLEENGVICFYACVIKCLLLCGLNADITVIVLVAVLCCVFLGYGGFALFGSFLSYGSLNLFSFFFCLKNGAVLNCDFVFILITVVSKFDIVVSLTVITVK